MYLKTNPQVADQIIPNQNSFLNLNNQNFAPNIYISDVNGNNIQNIDPTIFSLFGIQHVNDANGNLLKATEIMMHNCSALDFVGTGASPEYYLGSLCFDNSSMVLYLENSTSWYGSGALSFFRIEIRICGNTSSNVTCQSPEAIGNTLNGMEVDFSFIGDLFNLQNFEHPIQPNYGSSYSETLHMNFKKNVNLAIMEVDFIQDDNILFNNKNYDVYVQNDPNYYESYFLYNSTQGTPFPSLLMFDIIPSSNKRIISRTYQKLNELLSALGGIASFLFMIGHFLVKYFIEIEFSKILVQKLYILPSKTTENSKSIKNNDNSQNIILKNPYPTLKINELSMIKHIKNDNELEKIESPKILDSGKPFNVSQDVVLAFNDKDKDNLQIKTIKQNNQEVPINDLQKEKQVENSQKEEKIQRNENKPVDFSLLSYSFHKLKQKLSKKNVSEDGELILKIKEKYEKEMDICNLFARIQELEKIKEIIFNDKQKFIFENIPKPKLHSKEEEYQDIIEKEDDENDALNHLFSHFSNLTNSISQNQFKTNCKYFEERKKNSLLSDFDKALIKFAEKRLHMLNNR